MSEKDSNELSEKKERKEKKENKLLKYIGILIIGIIIGILIMGVLNVLGLRFKKEVVAVKVEKKSDNNSIEAQTETAVNTKITFGKDSIATINGGEITESDLFSTMKKYNGLNFLIEQADKAILKNKYELTEEQQQEIKDQANYYLSMYQSYYGYTEEEFLTQNGFSNHDDFVEYLSLDYKRDLYIKEYAGILMSEEDINNYYNNYVYGDIDSKHILVKISNDMTEEKALALAKEIIKKLDKGATFDEVKEKYADKITYEELGYQGFNSNLEESYMEALKTLENGKYTTEPVKTSYGYHIIYRINQKDKASLEDLKSEITDILIEQKKKEDETFSYKALIKMREENGLTILDEELKEQYEEYCNSFLENTQTTSPDDTNTVNTDIVKE